jgi:2-keto-4-pentenoate hydratase
MLDMAEGRRVVGKKIGLTSQAVQQQLGVDQPDYGVLFADMEFLSGSEVPASRLIQPKAEGEIAFVVGRDLDGESLSWGRFLHGLEYALPAIEIVDSAIQDWKLTLVDTVADNASCGLYVLGLEPAPSARWISPWPAWISARTATPRPWAAASPAWATRCSPPTGWPAPCSSWATPSRPVT